MKNQKKDGNPNILVFFFLCLLAGYAVMLLPGLLKNYSPTAESGPAHTEWGVPPEGNIYILPINTVPPLMPGYDIFATVTAYNTVPEQTDGDPCIGAGGNVCGRDDVIACPRRLKLGTAVILDGKRYICLDRMNRRYTDRFDVNFGDNIDKARAWGKKTMKITIFEE